MSSSKNYIYSYKKSGVDVRLGNELVKLITPIAEKTKRRGNLSALGGFGGIFDIKTLNYKDPLLVSTTDGVGTKILLAKEMQKYHTIGIDLVAMSVNDIIVHGAEPLFFLDYIAVEKLNNIKIIEIIQVLRMDVFNQAVP